MMNGAGRWAWGMGLFLAAVLSRPVLGEENVSWWALEIGETTLSFRSDLEELHGVRAGVTGQAGPGELGIATEPRGLVYVADPDSDFLVGISEGGGLQFQGSIRHDGGLALSGPGGRRTLESLELFIQGHPDDLSASIGSARGGDALSLQGVNVQVDPVSGTMFLSADDVVLTPRWAAALGLRQPGRQTVGTLILRGALQPLDGEYASLEAAVDAGNVAGAIGPDVIVGDLHTVVTDYGYDGDIYAFSVGTTSCNQGDQELLWVSSTNQHPVITQNMFRLKNDRFEQLGQSWLKHGFFALQGNYCALGCTPSNAGGSRLGVGCSDPYSASLNGQQSYLGPKWEVNAHTGYFPYPPSRPAMTQPVIDRRLQVHNADLKPALNEGARYFVESQYVTPDDAAAGNGNNNASHREVSVKRDGRCQGGPRANGLCYEDPDCTDTSTEPPTPYDCALLVPEQYTVRGIQPTRRTQPGIRAWQDHDAEVVETDVQVPGEGLFILAAKTIDQGDGTWRYEYAVQNLNSDRSGGSFTVPLPDGAVVLNPGFHDVDYHSGEPFDGTDWEPVITEEAITWSTTPYAKDLNANALRWGTLYNFRFESNAAPGEVTVTLGLFKPGDPGEVSAQTIGPAVGLSDCNENGIPDFCDISCAPIGCEPPCGTSNDCNGNGIPDECEPDCNENGVADGCDIRDGTSEDCQPNGIPDDCEPDCDGDGVPDDCDVAEDCDGDGIEDCDDYCRCTSAEGACVCPPTGCCLYPVGIELCGIPPEDCLLQGGTPDCQGSPCAGGCMLDEIDGDFDRDGDRDIEDTGAFSACFSGPTDMPGFTEPSMECRARFDFDNNGAVELLDYKTLRNLETGPMPSANP